MEKCICEKLKETKFDPLYNPCDENEIDLGVGNYTYLAMRYNGDTKKYSLIANGNDEVEKEIKFCPFCGKKLF